MTPLSLSSSKITVVIIEMGMQFSIRTFDMKTFDLSHSISLCIHDEITKPTSYSRNEKNNSSIEEAQNKTAHNMNWE